MMRFNLPTFLGISLLLTAISPNLRATDHKESRYAIIDIDQVGPVKVNQLKGLPAVSWWIEAGSSLLVLANQGQLRKQLPADSRYEILAIQPRPENLHFIQAAHEQNLGISNGEVLIYAGRTALVQTDGNAPKLSHQHKSHSAASHARLLAFTPNAVLSSQLANQNLPLEKAGWSGDIREAVEKIDKVRWFRDVETLAAFNRYSHGANILQARDWIKAELSKLPNVTVELQEFRVGSSKAYNVVATIPGKVRPNDHFIIGAHYDSISESPHSSAPGAEDNGSGTAGIIEMARLFAEHPSDSTLIFIAFSGEEQGLNGSYFHAGQLSSENRARVKGVINMDMIGYTKGGATLDCLLETERIGESLMNTLSAAAREFTTLKILTTFNAWGSDHVPYLEKNIPAVLTIDNDWSEYPEYHRTGDKPDLVTKEMAEQIMRMNVATIARLGGGFN